MKIIDKANDLSIKAKTGIMTGAIMLGTAVNAFAADPASDGLDPTVKSAITEGFTKASTSITVVIGLGVVATIGIISVSGGAKAGIKWVKGIFSKAA